jgi:hypothetical protein
LPRSYLSTFNLTRFSSSCPPPSDWSLDLPQHFPFLFPFSTRYNFLQSTSFVYAKLILKWQSQQARGQDNSRRNDGVGFLGWLQRQKARISRKHIFESAVKAFELSGSSSSVLEQGLPEPKSESILVQELVPVPQSPDIHPAHFASYTQSSSFLASSKLEIHLKHEEAASGSQYLHPVDIIHSDFKPVRITGNFDSLSLTFHADEHHHRQQPLLSPRDYGLIAIISDPNTVDPGSTTWHWNS